ncbi:MAG TPA: RNA 2',3'-cyclic phosphodiesterase [Steroidobacteraceae bacterium]|jgi:2'-5' RNA ligase|nr:RNA 2',3'-cyclic phosphodiesterase [Steroidobacteraceae bacterium]
MAGASHVGDATRPEPQHRLFFALWPSEAMQLALANAARTVLAACDGTSVPTQNLHLTLAFLGNVPASRITELIDIGARVAAARGDPIAVTLDRIDYWRKPQLLCATATSVAPGATALAADLKRALTESGFAPDLKPFRAHATLARKVRRVTRDRNMAPVRWSFDAFRLVESRTAPEGSLYSSREIFGLDEMRR